MSDKFGFSIENWESAKLEAKQALIERARVRGMMPYSELVHRIHAISIEAHDVRLSQLLAEISTEENAAGRGMISALVVHKVGDMQPGAGFFELAQLLGKNTRDILECWINEVKKVHSQWTQE